MRTYVVLQEISFLAADEDLFRRERCEQVHSPGNDSGSALWPNRGCEGFLHLIELLDRVVKGPTNKSKMELGITHCPA